MKKIILILCILLPAFVHANKKNGKTKKVFKASDVLATYTEGGKTYTITRQEFYKSLGRNVNYYLSSEYFQKRTLKRFATKKFGVIQAKKQKLDQSTEYKKKLKDAVEKRLLISSFLRDKFPRDEKLRFKVKMYRIRHLILRLKTFKYITIPDPSINKRIRQLQKRIKDKKRLAKMIDYIKKRTVRRKVPLVGKEYFEFKKRRYKRMNKIQLLLSQQGPDAFPALAKKYGEDGSRRQGGSLGMITVYKRNIDKTFLRAACALKKGEVSEIIETEFGLHLIKCDDIFIMILEKFN